MTNTSDTGKALRPSYELDEHGAAALARLAGRYADDLPAIQRREVVRVPAVIHAVIHHQARRLLPNFLLIPRRNRPRTGPRTSPTPCPCRGRPARTSTAWKPPCCAQPASLASAPPASPC